MTLTEFAAANPDLRNNWDYAAATLNDLSVAWIRDLGSFDAYLRAAAEAYGVTLTTGGGTTTTTTGGAISPLFDPRHILMGYTRQGYEVYSLIDESGRVVEWYDVPGAGATGTHYLASRVDPASYVYQTNRPGSGGTVTPATTKTGWDKTSIVVALIGAAGLFLAYRSGKK